MSFVYINSKNANKREVVILLKKLAVLLLICIVILSLSACGQPQQQTKQEIQQEESEQTTETKYPEKPINVLQGFNPGGGSDTLAQITQPTLEKILGSILRKPVHTRSYRCYCLDPTLQADKARWIHFKYYKHSYADDQLHYES